MSRSPATPLRRPLPRGGRRDRPVVSSVATGAPPAGGWSAGPGAVRIVAAVLGVGLLVAPVTGAAAATTTDGDDQPSPRLVVTALDAVVGPLSPATNLPEETLATLPSPDATARLLVENPTDEQLRSLRLVVEVGAPITDRSGLRRRLDDPARRTVRPAVVLEQTLDPITAGDIAQVRITVPGAAAALAPPAGSTSEPVRVVPITIAVVEGATILDEVTTAIVGLSGAEAPPLETAVVLPIDHDPTTTTPAVTTPGATPLVTDAPTDGPPPEPPGPDPALLPGGRVDRLAQAVEAAPPGAISVAPAAHTLEALAASSATAPSSAELLERIRAIAAADRGGIVSTPLLLAAVPTLATDEGTAALAALAVADGRLRLGAQLEAAAGASHLGVAPQTTDSLDLVPGDLLVTRWDDAAGVDLVADPSSALPPAVRTAVAPSGRALQVLVADPWIEQALAQADGVHGAALDAHRIVVESALVWADDPAAAGRVLAIVPPVGWSGAGQLSQELATRLADTPWLRLASPTTVVQRAASRGSGWSPPDSQDAALASLLPRVGAVDDRAQSLSTAVDDTTVLDIAMARDEVLRAVSAWPAASRRSRAVTSLDVLDDQLDLVEGLTTVPDDTTVTLASERGVVPVTVRREQGPPIDVVVELSPQGRLVVEEGALRTVSLEEDGTATVGFDTRALGTGTIPVEVRVLTPDGRIVLADAVLRVRATAVSTPALAGIAVFVLLLLLLGRRRRSSSDGSGRPRLEVVR